MQLRRRTYSAQLFLTSWNRFRREPQGTLPRRQPSVPCHDIKSCLVAVKLSAIVKFATRVKFRLRRSRDCVCPSFGGKRNFTDCITINFTVWLVTQLHFLRMQKTSPRCLPFGQVKFRTVGEGLAPPECRSALSLLRTLDMPDFLILHFALYIRFTFSLFHRLRLDFYAFFASKMHCRKNATHHAKITFLGHFAMSSLAICAYML